jgi:tetratricopeptide (TPR) repeat protein
VDDRSYKLFRNIAVALALLWVGWALWEHLGARGPGDSATLTANNMFDDRHYDRALATYQEALAEAPDHVPALRGMANSLIQLGRYEDALITLDRAMALDPDFPGHYAIRGIVHDHMGDHQLAMADYRQALAQDAALADGMHWLDRLLYNVPKPTPTIADRLRYLEQQMALPEPERLLLVPEIDASQRPYDQ